MKTFKKLNLIAEVGLSHNGNMTLAHSYIESAARSGATAIKFQTHYAAEESSRYDKFRVRNKFIKYSTRYDYWKNTEFTPQQWSELKKHADEKNIIFFSTPFSIKAVNILSKIGVNIWKIASGELTNHPLIERIADLKQPIILSTGMSDYNEIDSTIDLIKKKHKNYSLAQCTSLYPCPPEKLGLNLINDLKSKYNCSVGFSDHSGNALTPILAKAYGADFIEVHVVYDKSFIGFDTKSSITFDELSEISENIRYTEKILKNKVDKLKISKQLTQNKFLFQKSVYSKKNLRKNHKIKFSDLLFMKPAKGILAKDYKTIIGKKLTKAVSKNSPITKTNIDK